MAASARTHPDEGGLENARSFAKWSYNPQHTGLGLDRDKRGHNYYFFNFWLFPKITSAEMGHSRNGACHHFSNKRLRP